MSDNSVKCSRCLNQHKESERVLAPCRWLKGANTMVCPRCKGTTYYRVEPAPAA